MHFKLLPFIICSTLAVGAPSPAGAENTATATVSAYTINRGGFVEVRVPDNQYARGVTAKLSDVIDSNGQQASFRIQIYDGKTQVAYRRFTLSEPGGTFELFGDRAFNRVRIYDDEGTVQARLAGMSFCKTEPLSIDYCYSQRLGSHPAAMAVGDYSHNVSAGGFNSTTTSTDNNSAANNTNDGVASNSSTTSNSSYDPTTEETGTGSNTSQTAQTTEPQTNTSSNPGRPQTGTSSNVGDGTRTMTTPITRMTQVRVQAGPSLIGGNQPTHPWIDQFKLSQPWTFKEGNRIVLDSTQLKHNQYGMPVAPAGLVYGNNSKMDGGPLWTGSPSLGSNDIAGTWRLYSDGTSVLVPWTFNINITKRTNYSMEFTCIENCQIILRLINVKPNATPPKLVRLTDGNGVPVSDQADLNAGMVTRASWRKALYGYSELRFLANSGANSSRQPIMRYDAFPKLEYASWQSRASQVPYRHFQWQKTSKPAEYDIRTGMGMPKSYTPMLARLKAAYEIGAVYHHNFPPMFLENKTSFDPSVMGMWAEDLWADPSYTEAQRRSILNDYELQHVDEFGAEVYANRSLLVNNQIKIEVGNEVWNFAYPYAISLNYFKRKFEFMKQQMGWPQDYAPASAPNAVQAGYDLTKAIARLRYKYPDIEWRGVMAVMTGSNTRYRNPKDPAPATPHEQYNAFLYGMIKGYELFWMDYGKHHAQWSQMYAPEPARPGDWFEAQGTTYFSVESMLPDKNTYIAGIPAEEMLARVNDRSQWKALRAEILDFVVNAPAEKLDVTAPRGAQPFTSSLPRIKVVFQALTELADVYGMQVGSYEGGNHSSYGSYFAKQKQVDPMLAAFWRDFSDSVEMGLIQAAIHDAAVEVGYMRLADFDLFFGGQGNYIFGSRKHFGDVTGRYCEYARWMPRQPRVPVGLENTGALQTPHERCGNLIAYLNQARSRNYYVGQNIPELKAFVRN